MSDTYYLVDPGAGMPRWCALSVGTEGGAAYVDFKGRSIPCSGARPLAHVEGGVEATLRGVPPEVAALERSLAFEHLLDPWSAQGWLSPGGRLYGCAFFRHDDLAHALLRRTPDQLMEEGFLRVHESSFQAGGRLRRGVTRGQAETLAALGFEDVAPPGRRRGFRPEPDRHAPPPRFAVLPPGFALAPRPLPPAAPADVLRRLSAEPGLEGLEEAVSEVATELGGGCWSWLVVAGDLNLGGEDADWLMAAEGLHLRVAAFDQVEVSAWPVPGLHGDADAREMLAATLAGAPPSP